jgi:outer membrane protein
MRLRTAILSILVLVTTTTLTAADSHQIGVFAATSQIGDTSDDDGAEIAFDNGEGFGASLTCFYGRHFAVEAAATALKHDGVINAGGQTVLGIGSLDIIPITATAQWHLARDARVSPYVGAGVAYVLADDLESEDLDLAGIGTVNVDNEVTWTAQAGVNVNLTRRFAVALDAKYIAYQPKSAPEDGDEVELDLNPIVFSAGVKIRF